MKELSIKEKAKHYDEAIERANELMYVSDKDSLQCKTVEHIFPELKESEDERIRQRIIHALHGDVLEMSEIKEAIAWLEKQGEKDNISIDFVLGYLGIKPAYKDGNAWCILLGDNIQEGICGFGDTKEEALIAFIKELIEKQGMSAKLSEEEQNRFAKGVLTSCASSFINYLDAHKYEGKMCVSNGECEDIENAFQNGMWDKLHRYYCKYIEKQSNNPQGKSALESVMEEKIDNQNCVKPVDRVKPKFKVGDLVVNNISGCVCQVTEIRDDEYCIWPLDGEIKGYLKIIQVDNDYHLWTIQDAKAGDVLVASDGSIFLFAGVDDCACKYYVALTTDNIINFNRGLEHYWETSRAVQPATQEQRDQLEKAMTDAGYTFDFDKKELNKIEHKPVWSEDDKKMIDAAIRFAHEYGKHGLWCWLKSLKDRFI